MKRLATAIITLSLLTGAASAIVAGVGASETTSEPPIAFGMEAGAIGDQQAAGVAPDYGTFWIGPWTLKSGWGGPDNQLQNMRSQGVTPAIHFYYWGDDISPDCVENGCWSSLHNAQKDRAGWNQLADQMIEHLNTQMEGEEVVIFFESEFNKGGISNWEPWDTYMAEMMDKIHAGYPNAKIVMSLGSWNRGAWDNFDQGAAAADYTGIQGMRGSTRDSDAHYRDLFETTLSNAQYLHDLFGKPVFLQDIALSSYPEPEYLQMQAAELQEFFDGLPQLKAAGVEAIVYRSFRDSPNMDLANYYGEAERHWGLSYSGPDSLKPAGQVWIDGVKAERADAAQSGGNGDPFPFSVSFSPSANVNEWWVEVYAQASEPIAAVAASHDGGAFVTLPATSWGSYAKSFHAPYGGTMTYKATAADGRTAQATFTWPSGEPVAGSEPAPEPEPEPTPAPEPTNTAPTAALTTSVDGMAATADASASSDPESDALSFTIDFGDGTTATTAQASHTYAAEGTYTVTVTVSDGEFSDSASSTLEVVRPNQAPTAALALAATDLTVEADATGSSDPDGDALSYTIDFGDGTTATTAQASHTYAAEGTYTVTVTVSDGAMSDTVTQTVTVTAPAPEPAFTADFQLSSNVNEWWVEVYVTGSQPIDRVEVRVDGGTSVDLPLKSWGSYAESVHAPVGSQVVFTAYSADRSVDSTTFTWMQDEPAPEPTPEPTPEPSPEPAFDATFSPKTQSNRWWVEVDVSANQDITKVEVSKNGGRFVTMDLTEWGSYAKKMSTGKGGEIQFRATSSTGETDLSDVIIWG